jgi:type II secretory pathway component PulJ
MKMMNNTNKSGFTLIEASASVTVLAIALGLAMGGFMFVLKNTTENDVQSELDIDVQLAMERLKKDLRLSSLDEIFYYPAGPGPYTALSFPMARDDDGDDLFELDADGKVIWDLTVVYHIRPTTPNQLVITTFDNRITTLTDTQRQQQLDSVVATGDGTSTFNSGNASSHVIFENLLDWSILPKQGTFDAYSPITKRETTSLGFVLLSDGPHTFEFKVAGKNAAATGYKIGIDQLQVSPSHSAREAETQTVSAQSGATVESKYMENGSWKGNHQLYFPATAAGQTFSLKMKNDRWEETNFGAVGYVAEDTEVKFDETLMY